MTDNTPQLDIQIGDACEIDPAAGPLEATDNIGDSDRDVPSSTSTPGAETAIRAVRFLDEPPKSPTEPSTSTTTPKPPPSSSPSITAASPSPPSSSTEST